MSVVLSPDPMPFGPVNIGVASPLMLTITVSGFGPYSIVSFSNANPDFNNGLFPGLLPDGANTFEVVFSPSMIGAETDTLKIMIFNAADSTTREYDLPLSGTGVSASLQIDASSGPVIDEDS